MARRKGANRYSSRSNRYGRANAGAPYGRGGRFGQGGPRGAGGGFGKGRGVSSLLGAMSAGAGGGGGGGGGAMGMPAFTGLSGGTEGQFNPGSFTTHPQNIPFGLTLPDVLQIDPYGQVGGTPFSLPNAGPAGLLGGVASGPTPDQIHGIMTGGGMRPPSPFVSTAQPTNNFGATADTHQWGGARVGGQYGGWANNPNNPANQQSAQLNTIYGTGPAAGSTGNTYPTGGAGSPNVGQGNLGGGGRGGRDYTQVNPQRTQRQLQRQQTQQLAAKAVRF